MLERFSQGRAHVGLFSSAAWQSSGEDEQTRLLQRGL